MSIDAGDLFRIAQHITMPEQVDAYNVLGVRCESGTCTEAEFLTAAATWVTGLYANLQGVIHNQVDLAEGTLNQVVWSVDAWVVDRLIGTILPSFTPTDANDMLPHAVAGVISFPTDIPRKFGRVFIPGLSEVQQADSLLVSGAATALANFATALRTAFTAGSASFLYRVLGQGGLFDDTTGFSVNGLVGSQRKRKPGVGI